MIWRVKSEQEVDVLKVPQHGTKLAPTRRPIHIPVDRLHGPKVDLLVAVKTNLLGHRAVPDPELLDEAFGEEFAKKKKFWS